MLRKNLKMSWWGILLFFALAACSGAIDGPAGGGGPLGGTPNGNFAQGTLGSQPEIQEMSNGCLSLYTMRFSGESIGAQKSWFQLQPDQKSFPNPGLITKVGKDSLPNEEICPDCEGRIVRMIDFGNPDFNPLRFGMDFGLFMASLRNQMVKPEILDQARYQDFAVSAVSDVSFKGMPVVEGNLYVLLLSNKPMEPITEATAFASVEELSAMMACSKHPEDHPFMTLRSFTANYKDPEISIHLPPPGKAPVEISTEALSGASKVKKPSSPNEENSAIIPGGQPTVIDKFHFKDDRE